jgi:hypothetical protein
MLTAYLSRPGQLQFPISKFNMLLLESVFLSFVVDWLSNALGAIIPVNPFTIFVFLFLVVALLSLIVWYRWNGDTPPAGSPRSSHFGSLLSLSFLLQITLMNCSTNGTSPIVTASFGAIPLVAGMGITGVLEKKETARLSTHSVLQGTVDMERQPALVLAIMDALSKTRKSVSQSDIEAVCHSLSRRRSASKQLSKMIPGLMAMFINERGKSDKLLLNKKDGKNWSIETDTGIHGRDSMHHSNPFK